MCSVNDSECAIDDKIMPSFNKVVNLEHSECKKCGSDETVIVLRGKDAYCNSCFLASVTHKFRATLGKSKIVRPNDNVLVAHSGKAGSTVLLHLIKAGMHESVHKRLMFKTIVLFIDEGIVKGKTLEERKTINKRISEVIERLGFTGFTISISESLSEIEPSIRPINSPDLLDNEKIKEIFNSISSGTARDDFLLKLRNRLLIRAASKLKCNKIFTGESATKLSISILSNISMGRGAHLSLDVGFSDTRYKDVMIVRPMRNFFNEEIIYYLYSNNLPILPQSDNNSIEEDCHTSIQKLTEKFLNELEMESHGTVSTVFRTGEKLSFTELERKSEKNCVLCCCRLDTKTLGEISAIQATDFSRRLSNLDIISESDSEDSKLKIVSCNGDCNCYSSKNNFELLKENLCYGCRLILSSFKNKNTVPSFMLNEAKNLVSQEEMRDEISDFLL